MIDTLRKVLLAGLGTLELTDEKLHATLGDLIKRGEISEQEGRELAGQWQRRLARRREELQQEARAAVQRALRGLDVATQQELEALTSRVDALEQQARSAPRELGETELDAEC
jgi:polyhydroxyalkanoate synthesis regulator phasin